MDITISKNRYLQGKGVKTLQAVTQEWNEFIKDFEKPCLSNLPFYAYSSYLTEFYNLEDKERLSDNENDRRKELKGYIDSLKFHGGYYFGGTFESNTRGNAVTSKSLITLDIDNISPDIDFLDLVQNNSFLKPYEYIIHSTAKHFPKHQRYRLIIPLEEALTEDIALKYECIARHVANTIMDISKFDKTAFDDTHLMLYPIVAQNTPPKYYTYYHNETKNFLNSQEILSQYNYHDRYTFQGVERPAVPELPPTQKLYTSSSDLITSRDKDNLRVLIAQELQENNISVPDVTSTKKFGCVCGSSDACNFGRGYVCNCFSSNHDSRLGKRGNGVYTYDIFDLYAYTHNLDTSRDFIKICYELSRKYNITLENSEQVERFLYKPTAIDDFQDVGNNTTVAHHNGNGNNSTSSNAPELPPYIKEKINEKTGELTYTLNCEILADVIRKKHDFILVKYANDRQSKPDFYLYEHGVYRIKNLDELRAFIKAYFLEPYKYYNSSFVDTKNITKVCNSLYTDYFKFVDSTQLNNNENIINFRNGLLYLDSMTLKPHTPSIYSTIQIDCDYNPNATNCPIFSDYINTLTNNNENVKRVILEVMGIAISNIKGHKMKMALFTIGKGDTGKSQIRLLTNKLIGFENTSGIDLDTLEERFGTSAIYQKRVIGSADMGFMNVKQLRTFKQITGGDGINCEFKGGAFFSYIFDGVVWFSANEMPRFGGDKGDWVYDRMIIAKCDNVIPKDKQDKNLVEKMMKEAPAIINILLSHVKDVIANGYEYHVPEECKLAREQYKKENSLVQTFLDECTEPRKSYDCCTTKKMYDVFKAWCSDNARGYTPTNQEFRKELVNIYKASDIKELEKKSPKGNRYYPFTLTISAKQDYINVYGYDSIYNEQ